MTLANKILMAIIFGLVILFIPQTVFASTYYVSTTGSNSNPGTQTLPWKTIQKAANSMPSGNTVMVSAGTYPEEISVSGSNLTFIAQGSVVTQAWDIPGSYNTVNGFEITDPNSNWGVRVGVSNVTTATGNLIENNNIHDTGQDGIWFFGYNNTYRGNYLHDIHNAGDTHVDYFQTWGPASGAIFERNICLMPIIAAGFSGGFQNIMVESQYLPVENLTFRNNIFVMGAPGFSAMNFWGADIPYAISDISVLNNTIVHIGNIGDEAVGFYLISGGEFRNNLVVDYGVHEYVGIYSSPNVVVSNNAVWKTDGNPPLGTPYPGDIWMQDPKLVNLTGLDFHLKSNSPLIDTGVDLSTAGVINDFDGNARPQGAGYDIGAYEFVVNTPSPTPTPFYWPGDINHDHIVNIQDYTLLSNAFGTNNAASDINSDGVVNVQDYILLSNNFGKTS